MTAPLSGSEEALVRLSAGLAAPDLPSGLLARAVVEASLPEVEEVVLQTHLFLGYPVTIEALAALRASHGGERSGEAVVQGPGAGAERAEGVMRAVYRGRTDRVRASMRELHPDLETWMVFDGYGRVLGRPGLELRVRELCIVAQLAAAGRPRQLHSHLFGAGHVGASAEAVSAALEIGLEAADERWRMEARALLARVVERGEADGG